MLYVNVCLEDPQSNMKKLPSSGLVLLDAWNLSSSLYGTLMCFTEPLRPHATRRCGFSAFTPVVVRRPRVACRWDPWVAWARECRQPWAVVARA